MRSRREPQRYEWWTLKGPENTSLERQGLSRSRGIHLSYMSWPLNKKEIEETAKVNQSLVYDSHQSSSLKDLRTKGGNKMTSCFRKRPAALQVSTWLSQHFGWLAACGKQDIKQKGSGPPIWTLRCSNEVIATFQDLLASAITLAMLAQQQTGTLLVHQACKAIAFPGTETSGLLKVVGA